jgi:PAS domain S-box-containing protein
MFQSIVLGARDGLWFWDLKSHEVYFSPRWKELLGYQDHELKNEYKTFVDLVHHEDREPFEAFLQQILQRNCEGFEKTIRMRHKDGSYRLILTKGGLIRDTEGKGVRMAGSHTDVTESKEAEDRLRLSESSLSNLIRMANEAIIAADEEGKILIFNQAAELLFGYSAKEAIGQNLQWLAPEEVRGTGQKIFQEFIDGPDKRRTLKDQDLVSCQRKDGKRFFASGSVVKTGNPGSQQVTFVLKDNAPEEHSAQVQKLEAIGQLAAGVAHEINTPIQYVGDNLEFFKDVIEAVKSLIGDNREALVGDNGELPHDLDFLLEEAPEALTQASDGASRVATIVRALKEFSHPSSDDLMPANLEQNLKSTITIARNEWKYHATLETEFEDPLDSVYCYPGDLNQVFLNLIVNAAHAIASADRGESGRIVVRTRKHAEMAEITIEDNGTGIPLEAQKRVFEPFYTTKEVGKGTGQGLALAHRIVCEKHHGELFFRTQPGQGTEFVIRIPLDPPVEQEVAS